MKIRARRNDDTLELDLEGELDAQTSAELEDRCRHEQQEGALHYLLDLGGLSRVSGSGLRVLLGLARSLPRSGGSLVLCGLERKVDEALEVSGLRASFEIASDRRSALQRSRELRAIVIAGHPRPLAQAEADEKVDYAIRLLDSNEPTASDDDPPADD